MLKPEAAIAANRFGLGARPGDPGRIGKDPQDWLLSQLAAPRGSAAPANPPASAQVLAQIRDLRVVRTRAELDAARGTVDALERLLDHAARLLPPDTVRRCAELADVILLEPGEAPGHSETQDLEAIRRAAQDELSRRG